MDAGFPDGADERARDMGELRDILGRLTYEQKLRLLVMVKSSGFPVPEPAPSQETSADPLPEGYSGY